VAVACPIFLSYASMFIHHMNCPTWLWCILCNSYVVDLYFYWMIDEMWYVIIFLMYE
jgi:hypothetical protein